VAFLNSHPRFRRENLRQLERHLFTDETFTLLRGRAALYIADGDGEGAGDITLVPLEPYKVYNVRAGVWHAIETGEDTSVLITENRDTSPENSPRLLISQEQLPPWDPRG
jgi:ureidoglycolate hydrolase